MKNEFEATIALFRSSCSWSNDVERIESLKYLLENPIIASYLVRQLGGTKLSWDETRGLLSKTKNKDAPKIACENLICRKTSESNFNLKFEKSIGFQSVETDLKRLYCTHYKTVRADSKRIKDERLRNHFEKKTPTEHKLVAGQMLALITGVPDFFVRLKDVKDTPRVLRAAVDQIWDDWAKGQLENYNKDLYYEEFLKLDLVNHNLFFKKRSSDFMVQFDVNMGEFDSSIQELGKLKTSIHVTIAKSLLKWAKENWNGLKSKDSDKAKEIIGHVGNVISAHLEKEKDRFEFLPWVEGVERIIAKDLICLLYTSPSPRDATLSRMPSSA